MASKALTRPGDEGLLPYFTLINGFIDDLVPTTFGDIIDENGITVLEDFQQVSLEEWLLMFVGMVVCVAVGVLFMVIIPIWACCYCCCRCCCNCCQPEKKLMELRHPNDIAKMKPSTCKKWTCSSILLVLVSVMFATVICSFVATSMIKNEIGENGQAVNDLIIGIEYLETYLHDSIDDIDDAVFPPLNDTKYDVYYILDKLPETTVDTLANVTGIDPALYELDEYAQNIPALNANLTIMDDSTQNLILMEQKLDAELSQSRDTLNETLKDCINSVPNQAVCGDLLSQLDFLTPDAQYDRLSNVTNATSATQIAIDLNVPASVSVFVESFENISNTIENEIGTDIDEIKKQIDDVQKELEQEFHQVSQNIKNITFVAVEEAIEDVQPMIETVGTGVYLFLYVISTLCLVPVILYLCGLPFGWFGGPSAAKHGSNCLMAGVALTFIFGFLFMLTTTITFAIGGVMQGSVCRHVVDYDDTMQALETVVRNTLREDSDDYPYNLTVKELIDNCRVDEALYTAFNLAENGFNVTEYLDLDNTQLPELIEELKNITFTIESVEIITDEVNQTVLAIESQTDQIDYFGYSEELKKNVTKIDVSTYAEKLREAAKVIEDDDPTIAGQLNSEADKLDVIHNQTILPMEEEKAILTGATKSTYDITSSVTLSSVMRQLTEGQEELNTNADKMVQDIVGKSADDVYNLLNSFFKGLADSIETDIARCRPAYDAITTVVYAPCVYFLYPFNAVWFSYGWYLAFGVLAIFFSTSVVGMFRVKAVGNKIVPFDPQEMELVKTATLDLPEHIGANKVAPMPSTGHSEQWNLPDGFVVEW